MWHVKFLTLAGKFGIARTENFEHENGATLAIEAYAKENCFTDCKMVDDGEYGDYRYTATTPNGRKGRNIAFVGPSED